MKLDPRHLAQLSLIVETGSFQGAADRLALTQPALSRNMRALEDRLGAPIFVRDGRRSVPNDLGLHLARNGLAIRVAEEQAENLASLAAGGSAGQLRIGAPPIVSGRFLTDTLSDFLTMHPKCVVELRTGLVNELRSMLERGQVDMVFGPQSAADPVAELDFVPLIDDRVAIICRADHPLTRAVPLKPSDLMQHRWLAHSRGSLLRQQTEAAMIASGVHHMRIACETDSIRSALEIVASTDLISTMPVATTGPYLEDKLVFLQYENSQFHRPLGAIQRANMPTNPVVKTFLALLKARVAVS
ncbi:LysR family transcriptional regulator [uncultured Tateyamaria sp.]|uniref:LysR family transcriptional regulator n=1 Tax=uncultured Tateyamaria sp. TaxID=455651 RepID=UPI00260C6653|nr:LysR family transcriptional regulator [uncultured Tateyamaria sp.]